MKNGPSGLKGEVVVCFSPEGAGFNSQGWKPLAGWPRSARGAYFGVSIRAMSRQDAQLRLFLADIKDRPDDDIPRLILADWLQDMGDPRGEFVHLQVMRARLPSDDPAAQEMHRRERQLLRQHAFAWLGPLADFASRWRFERGMIQVTAPLERFENGAGFPGVEAFAWVEAMTVSVNRPTRLTASLTSLVDTGVLRHLAGLDLSSHQHPLQALAHEDTAWLRSLRLWVTRVHDPSLRELANGPHLRGLEVLELTGGFSPLRDETAIALATSASLAALRRIIVAGGIFSVEGQEVLREAFGDRFAVGRRTG